MSTTFITFFQILLKPCQEQDYQPDDDYEKRDIDGGVLGFPRVPFAPGVVQEKEQDPKAEQNPSEDKHNNLRVVASARGGSRTLTPVRARDFESRMVTSY